MLISLPKKTKQKKHADAQQNSKAILLSKPPYFKEVPKPFF